MGLIVLAGGESARMGRDKALLPVGGITLLEHILIQMEGYFAATYISVGHPGSYAFLEREKIPDPEPGQGPMMGLFAALSASEFEKNFVIACDIPEIDVDFVRKLAARARRSDIVLASLDGTRPEPLFGIYDRNVLSSIQGLLDAGERSLLPLFDLCSPEMIVVNGSWFRNLNTMDDYRDYRQGLAG